MPDAPEVPFRLTDTESEPTDEQLEQLMRHVGETIRKEKNLFSGPKSGEAISVMADKLVERLLSGEK